MCAQEQHGVSKAGPREMQIVCVHGSLKREPPRDLPSSAKWRQTAYLSPLCPSRGMPSELSHQPKGKVQSWLSKLEPSSRAGLGSDNAPIPRMPAASCRQRDVLLSCNAMKEPGHRGLKDHAVFRQQTRALFPLAMPTLSVKQFCSRAPTILVASGPESSSSGLRLPPSLVIMIAAIA